MKIAFLSQIPIGFQGTPVTYRLVESFTRKVEVSVFAANPGGAYGKVHRSNNTLPLYEVDLRKIKTASSVPLRPLKGRCMIRQCMLDE